MSAQAAQPSPASPNHTPEVIVVGAGFGGITAAIELRRHGFQRIRILEKAPELGGTWFYNHYPGAACDVPSHLYSFSFAQRRDWSRLCSPQAEILAYMRDVAREHRVAELIETDTTVTSCAWSEESCRWTVETAAGQTLEADILILATGQLHQPAIPRLEGAERFEGHSFHSAEWDHAYRLAGRRVAVVGTGASAVQFVPEIAPIVDRLSVFQRTGNWFLPRRNHRYPALYRAAIERMPGLQDLRRRFVFDYGESLTAMIRHPRSAGLLGAARSAAFMRRQLKDPEVRRKAWPDYTFGCKRVLFSSDFLPALQRPNVDLVTDRIAAIAPHGIVTGDGATHEADCIIWATGFRTHDFMFPMQITGAAGRDLHEEWAGAPHAHLGMTVAGFPNMFILYGPNTNTSGGSIIFYLETQSAYVRQALQQMRRRGAAAIEVRADVEAASDRAVQARFTGTAWTRCSSWYRDEHGRIVANWPGYMREYLEAAAELRAGDFKFVDAHDRAAVTGAQ